MLRYGSVLYHGVRLTNSSDPRVARSRERVLESAIDLLAERGFEGASIEAISEQSGVAKTTIYRHWVDKAALVLDVIESLAREPVDPDTGSLANDLSALAGGLAHGLQSGPWAAMLPSLVDAAERDPEVARMNREFNETRHAVVKSIVTRARSRGEIRDEVSDKDIIELVAGPVFYRRLVTGEPTSAHHASHIAALVAELAAPRS